MCSLCLNAVFFVVRKLIIGVLLISLTASRQAHDFHASITQMVYNQKEKTVEISIRIFTDDFEKALSAASNAKIHLAANDKNDTLIEKYIHAHFGYVSPQKQSVPIKYIGHEIEADANWLYLEMPHAESLTGGTLTQNALMELFDDQVNMINIQYQSQKKTFVFRKSQSTQPIRFD